MGVSNAGTIVSLRNSGTISGGNGGYGLLPGASGKGMSNAGVIFSLSNSGTITGSDGVLNTNQIVMLDNLAGGMIGGASSGVSNSGVIGLLINAGTIDDPDFAIDSTGAIG